MFHNVHASVYIYPIDLPKFFQGIDYLQNRYVGIVEKMEKSKYNVEDEVTVT